eukprot:887656-Amphidinium_carterae.1
MLLNHPTNSSRPESERRDIQLRAGSSRITIEHEDDVAYPAHTGRHQITSTTEREVIYSRL